MPTLSTGIRLGPCEFTASLLSQIHFVRGWQTGGDRLAPQGLSDGRSIGLPGQNRDPQGRACPASAGLERHGAGGDEPDPGGMTGLQWRNVARALGRGAATAGYALIVRARSAPTRPARQAGEARKSAA